MIAPRNTIKRLAVAVIAGTILIWPMAGCRWTPPVSQTATLTPNLTTPTTATRNTQVPQTLTPSLTSTAPLAPTPSPATSTEPVQPIHFTFAVIGDTRTQHDVHRSVVRRVIELSPDLVLHTGDLVADGTDPNEWGNFLDIEGELIDRIPFYPTLGNHEKDAPGYFDLFDLPGNERWYTFTHENARFICLEIDGYARFDKQSEQYAWLETTLAHNESTWLVVYFHIPPYSSYAQDSTGLQVRAMLVPLFERYGVDIVFNGHHHNYQRNEVNGMTYIVSGGGGAPLYEITQAQDYTVAYRAAYHVVFVTVTDRTLVGVVTTPDGEVLDRFVLESD